jgi:hypothetical protein
MDYYLKAESEEALWSALISAGVAQESEVDGVTYKDPVAGIALDVIGVIYKGTGQMVEVNDPEIGTYTYEEQEPIEGYHVNLRATSELTEQQKDALPLIDKPATPHRIWFGD